ncbi:MAG: ECF RNA polymerase sigma factor SigW [Chloroflexi bacterium ADurb.Bin180]|nr:MAG: ECF RNA polymerase sigma factor SigW [Chloroflexi bacterium ADurb.Bin180]HNR96507.1 sigma-70 family RNA polymerase sigma factor [Anaerolineae bacterium]
MDEQESLLVERAQQDPLAFAALYDQYVDRVYNYIYQRTGNHGDAEDLTARTFLKAFVHLQRYRFRGIPFAAWLYRIAHNAVANWHRDSHRHQMVALDAIVERSREDDRPEDLAATQEEHAVLLRAVRSLPAERQQLLILKFSEGLSNAEIGRIMHRTEGAIKSLFHRTLMTLREELDRQERQHTKDKRQ